MAGYSIQKNGLNKGQYIREEYLFDLPYMFGCYGAVVIKNNPILFSIPGLFPQ